MPLICSITRTALAAGFAWLVLVGGAPGSLRAEEVSLEMNGLTALATVTLADGQGLVGQPVILMVHGTLAHKDMDIITQQRELMAERGYNSLALSLTLGLSNRRGLYDCSVPHTHAHEDALSEIAAWIDWLADQKAGPVILMGHSRGGAQAALFTADTKDHRVAAMVLAAPMTYDDDQAAAGYKKGHGRDLAGALVKMGGIAPDDMAKGFGTLYCPGADVTGASFISYYGVGADRRDTPTILERISVPVLVAIAADDETVPDLPARLEGRALEKASIVTIDEAGHMFLDFAGEDLADAVDAFIQESVMAN